MHLTALSFEKRETVDATALFFVQTDNGPKIACEGDFAHIMQACLAPIQAGDFTAKAEEVVVLYSTPAVFEQRIVLVGLGRAADVTSETLRRAAGAVHKAVKARKIVSLSLCIPDFSHVSHHDITTALTEGLFSANYVFDLMKGEETKKEIVRIQQLQLLTNEPLVALQAANEVAKAMKGVYLARDLVNGNADDITPKHLAEVALQLSREYSSVTSEAFDSFWMESQGMHLALAVAKGSAHPPQFIVVNYRGNPETNECTVLVGKGITFDTGGLNLKGMGFIENQKGDMSGAAVVLGTIKALAELEIPVNCTAVIAACENAIGSRAYKPGDTYKSMSGKTVEVTNTDAEGRLTLADALVWAQTLHPTRLIDIATLTGAMVVALGHERFGIMANSDTLAQEILHAGERTHERGWQFPIYTEYKEKMKSDVADIKNAGEREGGAIFGAAFLKEFVGDVPWAHLDIAPVALSKEDRPYIPKMATGIGVRLFLDLFRSWSA